MTEIVVTGAAGFLGRAVQAQLTKLGYQSAGIDLAKASQNKENQAWVPLSNPLELASRIAELAPSTVIHCAFLNRRPDGMSSERYLTQALEVDLPLFEYCARNSVRLVLAGSSAIYGHSSSAAIDESSAMKPVTLYGVAKAAQECQLSFFAADRALKAAVARLFNLCGPGQGPGMLIPDWVSRVSAIADGAKPELLVRNRATRRDFVDVRDAARALVALARDFRAGEVVNVASGVEVSLRELGDELQRISGLTYEIVETHSVPAGTDPIAHCGSSQRIGELYGWKPEIGWRESLADAWRVYRAGRI